MKSKYNSKKCIYKGIKFDSQMEMEYYKHLLEFYNENEIILQPKFTLQDKFVDCRGNKHMAIKYIADFQLPDGSVIDVKGMETSDFKIKKKLFLYKFAMKLYCMTKAPKYYTVEYQKEWIELSELKKIRRERKKCKDIQG